MLIEKQLGPGEAGQMVLFPTLLQHFYFLELSEPEHELSDLEHELSELVRTDISAPVHELSELVRNPDESKGVVDEQLS